MEYSVNQNQISAQDTECSSLAMIHGIGMTIQMGEWTIYEDCDLAGSNGRGGLRAYKPPAQ